MNLPPAESMAIGYKQAPVRPAMSRNRVQPLLLAEAASDLSLQTRASERSRTELAVKKPSNFRLLAVWGPAARGISVATRTILLCLAGS